MSTWFDNYKWLDYSPIEDSTYCFVGRCFAISSYNHDGGKTETTFISLGVSSWN